ncbi:hypothetical protein [Clostridium baratii]|uniref:hypothetical protein n=1 Tax=Clostridium baratii TaxID=1561 RepID=UPI0029151FD1|nr:hypothetical protein [Clostridium baratii]MDU4912106.1 hypothetical protein [Clostridium baratii]
MNLKDENKKLKLILEENYRNAEYIKREIIFIKDDYKNKIDIIKKLERDIETNKEQLNKLKVENKKLIKKNKELNDRLIALRNSKLGKLTRKIWTIKKNI